jgi:hypothetical protein
MDPFKEEKFLPTEDGLGKLSNTANLIAIFERSLKLTTNKLLQKENLSGLCAVYKPSGISSSFVVGKIKYILQRHCTEHIFEMKQKCKIKVKSF